MEEEPDLWGQEESANQTKEFLNMYLGALNVIGEHDHDSHCDWNNAQLDEEFINELIATLAS